MKFLWLMKGAGPQGQIPPKWDGKAAERIVQILEEAFAEREEFRVANGEW